MIKKEEVSFYETYAYAGSNPSINITNENFYGGFAMGSPPLIDETIYYPVVQYHMQIRNKDTITETSKIIEIGRCELNDFDP